ncbi:phosphoesterase family-domain-containing protein [Penicillium pulvis]|uniref:phosphoesterase family-domain-containing protein n=1 Tax=Penicillium pulvis TaxID=1562058 RepID=UPI0025481E10|nr:phosphoesterase family-domain-containing protein [Penicillium pulvis]KAJ5784184.1 phosphoesterase family-domain-containing protein [Penicillium pulvis]
MAALALSYLGLDAFYKPASNRTLPMISFIVGSTEISEHPPYMPSEGAWLQKQIVEAVVNGSNTITTALFISYDAEILAIRPVTLIIIETGGLSDHVTPFQSDNGTTGKWIEDAYDLFGYTYTGPVSPWTRGGRGFTDRSDHNSQILFLEAWLEALGYDNVTTDDMEPWHREHMSNLVNAFEFSNPNFTISDILSMDNPVTDSSGSYTGTATCESTCQVQRCLLRQPNRSFRLIGYLTECRYLTFEKGGYALTNDGSSSTVSLPGSTPAHYSIYRRWIIFYNDDEGSESAILGSTIPAEVAITFLGNGAGYTMRYKPGSEYIAIREDALVATTTSAPFQGFSIYSVTYGD